MGQGKKSPATLDYRESVAQKQFISVVGRGDIRNSSDRCRPKPVREEQDRYLAERGVHRDHTPLFSHGASLLSGGFCV